MTHVVNNLQEAQQLYRRLQNERQLNILDFEGDLAEFHWTSDGGQGPVPMAWVRSGDGVIRFNRASFVLPPPLPQGQ